MLQRNSYWAFNALYSSSKRPFFSLFKRKSPPQPQTPSQAQSPITSDGQSTPQNTSQNPQELQTKEDVNTIQEFREMPTLKKDLSTRLSLFPPFIQLNEGHIEAFTKYSINHQLFSPYRWTPLIQKVKPSLEFHERMYEFRKVRGWEDRHTKELIDTIIFEALKGTDFDYYYDYRCEPSKYCKFHGNVDFLLYKKSGDHLPFVPILQTRKKMNYVIGKKVEGFNVYEAVGVAAWTLTNMSAKRPGIEKTRIIQTDGHHWRMYEFDMKGEFRKTGVYRPNSQSTWKKIYDDPEMQEVVLGMIRYAAFMHTENEVGLKKAYDFIDEAKYLEELDEETKSKFEKRKRFWKFLPKSLQDFFFDYR